MNRLTRKETNYLAGNGYRKCDYLLDGTPKVEALNKLGTLEDLEEELGIDLPTLFKALKHGIFIDLGNIVIFKIASIDLSFRFYLGKWYITYYHPLHGGIFYLYLKDFNKTWWIDKPKENDDE